MGTSRSETPSDLNPRGIVSVFLTAIDESGVGAGVGAPFASHGVFFFLGGTGISGFVMTS